jgi:hypothetical protein
MVNERLSALAGAIQGRSKLLFDVSNRRLRRRARLSDEKETDRSNLKETME